MLTIQPNALQVMKQDGVTSFPNECCGFLYGTEVQNHRIITQAIPVVNSKQGDQRRRFEIAPLDYIKAEQYALQHRCHLLGVYHTHPQHPAIASEHDLAQAMPYFSYVILSVLDGIVDDIKSWRLHDNKRVFYMEQIELSPLTHNSIS